MTSEQHYRPGPDGRSRLTLTGAKYLLRRCRAALMGTPDPSLIADLNASLVRADGEEWRSGPVRTEGPR